MSPNALRGLAPSYADDIYSVAITMWQLEARQQPYQNYRCNDTVAYNVVKTSLRPLDEPKAVRRPAIRLISPRKSPSFRSKLLNGSLSADRCRVNSFQPHQELFARVSRKLDFSRLAPNRTASDYLDKNVFRKLFQDVQVMMDLRCEYQKMYIKCWHADENVRPTASEMLVEFRRVLSYFKQCSEC